MAQMFVDPCGPPPDPCRSDVSPLFSTGITMRHIPLCEGPFCDCPTPAYGRARVTSSGTLDRTDWIRSWILSQLITRGEVSCDEHTLKKRAGGWWADAFRSPAGFRSGSKLWSLQWSLVSNEALIMAKAYATQALSYLMLWGIASRVKVEASYVSQKVMQLHVTVVGPGLYAATVVQGMAVPESGWMWQEYVIPAAQLEKARIGPRALGE